MATGAGWAPARPIERHGAPRGASPRSKSVAPGPRRPSPSPARSRPAADHSGSADSCRVRVAVRPRPKNSEDLAHGADFNSCVELQPESKRLKLKKNNWSCESYKFDEVFSENASQKRVYEAVAKPVVESVLEGYNGTVMAYGQTGTGKTYTVGRLGKDDPSERGIMVRALEHILSSLSFETDWVAISYLQLYLESVHDLLAPEKTNIPIVEDAKTGEVSLPGAAIVEVKDLEHVFQLLQIGEANRHAANTKMNTESSRSHAILIIHLQRSTRRKEESSSSLYNDRHDTFPDDLPLVLKSKLLIVDLAGSERIDKSGSEGHMIEEAKFINLSLTSLGKCINALAENSPHIPTRDSKLTRILRDSFGGTARTSLVVTIGPSARHYSETSSTVMFGQRAMKVVNTMKLKEEVDYEILYKKMEREVDQLTSEMERQQKVIRSEKTQMEKRLKESERSFHDLRMTSNMQIENLEKEKRQLESAVKKLMQDLDKERDQNNLLSKQVTELEKLLNENKQQQQLENLSKTKFLTDTTKEHEKEMGELLRKLEEERCCSSSMKDRMSVLQQQLCDAQSSAQLQESMAREMEKKLTKVTEEFTIQVQSLKEKVSGLISEKELIYDELKSTQEKVQQEMSQRQDLEDQIVRLKQSVSDNCAEESKTSCSMVRSGSGLGNTAFVSKSGKLREALSGQRGTISKIFEEVGLPNVLALLKSEDLDVQIHAVKVVANLAAEDVNQERIVEEGGLDALLSLLETSENTTIHRVTAGAVANLAMNGSNQGVIMNKGGARLLANVASKTDDPQTLRMVAGAIANLCGNEKLHLMLKQDGGIKALLGMFRSGHTDVIAQIARGIANFAKCESRMICQGHRKGRSLLIEDGVLTWMVAHSTMFSASTRRHIELAFCHLAQNEDNTCDIIASGGIKELLRITRESPREDTRNLAKKALDSNPAFLREIQ
ncbi:kinesin-like protein KIN-UA isoform X1 [Miscanthus floridulus]|uniref:kinesin-like protein KIN-UA isoform X1 n=1 Tax=Miscanthus floridulus TaxID=154761 RepID=UPI00345B428D